MNIKNERLPPILQISLPFKPGEILDIVNTDTLLISSEEGRKIYWLDLRHNTTTEYTPPTIEKYYDRITAAWYTNKNLQVLNGNGRTLLTIKQFSMEHSRSIVDTLNYIPVKALPLRNNSFVIKKLMEDGHRCNLARCNTANKEFVQDNAVPRLQEDCLATDGTLAYDGKNAVFFTNMYNSSITKYDTFLNRIYTDSTIDKSSRLPIVEDDTSRHRTEFISPHRIINYFTAADPDHLFVLSAVMASNDLRTNFIKHTPLDLYSSETGHYEGSYHLEDVDINTIRGVRISHNLLFIVVGSNLYIYNYKKILYEIE